MDTLTYLLQVTLCWLLFFSMYFVFLRRLTFHTANRWYLLCSLLGGLLLPFLRYFSLDIDQTSFTAELPLVQAIQAVPEAIIVQSAPITSYSFGWLWAIYGIGICVALVRLGAALFKIRRLYVHAEKKYRANYTLLYTQQEHLPFSFFNGVYISTLLPLTDEYDEVLSHELAHVRSRHSYDILLIEIIHIIFWFHPLIYFYRSAIRQTHEYLADSAVLSLSDKKHYSKMLLKQSMSGFEIALAHHFFHSHIKKRIDMMYQKKSGPSAWLKYALALPVLFVLTFAFAKQVTKSDPANSTLDVVEARAIDDPGEQIFKVVEQMPMFPGCEDIADYQKRKECADKRLMEYLYSSVHYPEEARANGISGRVYIQFVVEKDGSISSGKILRDIGGGCGDVSLNTVMGMNDLQPWTPGYQDGKPVRVYYTLPVGFKLEDAPAEQSSSESNIAATNNENVYKVVDVMPMFPGCDEVNDYRERKVCSDNLLIKYIHDNVKYPKAARKAGVEGRAYVQFVVNTDGLISDIKVLRTPHPSMTDEVVRVVKSMNTMGRRWIAGRHKGETVKVSYILPVFFELDGGSPAAIRSINRKEDKPEATLKKVFLQAHGALDFDVNMPEKTQGLVQLAAMDGSILYSQKHQFDRGINHVQESISSSIPVGIYILRVSYDGKTLIKRVASR